MHASPVQPWHQALFHQSDMLPRSQGHFEKLISPSDQPNNRRWARTHQNRIIHAFEVSGVIKCTEIEKHTVLETSC
jgi:hypothetical protein